MSSRRQLAHRAFTVGQRDPLVKAYELTAAITDLLMWGNVSLRIQNSLHTRVARRVLRLARDESRW